MAKIETVYVKTKKEADKFRGAAMKGKRYLDNGAYATAYLHKCKRRVTKIGGLRDPYLLFAKEIINANSNNPFLPKIYSITEYKSTVKDHKWLGMEFYVVEMERLYPLEDFYDDYDAIVDAFETIVESGRTVNHFIKRRTKRSLAAASGIFSVKVEINPHANRFLKHLRKMILTAMRKNKAKCSWDIHDGNIMCRKDGQVVLIDPICRRRAYF